MDLKHRLTILAALVSAAGLLATGCGDDDGDTTTPAQTTDTTAPQGGSLEISMGDYFFQPQDATAAAGKVKISAVNNGQLPHELVLAKTNADPSKLPTSPMERWTRKAQARGEAAGRSRT